MTTLQAVWARLRHRRSDPGHLFDPTSPLTWDVLPPGYSWTRPAPHGGCPCGGQGVHLISADGADLTRAIVNRRGGAR